MRREMKKSNYLEPSRVPTDDDVKHIEFLYSDLKDYRDIQDRHYSALVTKTTFLCGFLVTVLTLYGTYAPQVNNFLRVLTLLTLGTSLFILCGAFKNRKFYQSEMSDIDVDASNYFDKVYQAVSNIKKACDDNEAPLELTAKYIRWGVRVLVLGVAFLILSFCFSRHGMVKSKHHVGDYYWTATSQGA